MRAILDKCLLNHSADIFSDTAEVAGCDAEHGGEVLQWNLLEVLGFFAQHFFVALVGVEHDQVMAAAIDATNGQFEELHIKVLERGDVEDQGFEGISPEQVDLAIGQGSYVFFGWFFADKTHDGGEKGIFDGYVGGAFFAVFQHEVLEQAVFNEAQVAAGFPFFHEKISLFERF